MGTPIDSNSKFESCGATYMLHIELYSDTDANSIEANLDAGNVMEFEYSNSLNGFYINASVLYNDSIGVVDKFLRKQYTYCDVDFCKFADDGKDEQQLEVLRDESFLHTFLVQSIEIVNRVDNTILYRISMVDVNWFGFRSTIQYSNYSKNPESILKIIKEMLVNNNLRIDEESFDKIQTEVKMNYIAHGNQNLEQAINYLLARQFYYKKKDDSYKCIVYNDITDKYGIFDLKDKETISVAEQMLISLFGTQLEQYSTVVQSNLGTVTAFSNSDLFYSLYDKSVHDYDIQHDKFVDKSIKEQDLLNIYNKHFQVEGYKDAFEKRFESKRSYRTRTTYWNNYHLEQIYSNMTNTFLNDNALIVNTTGSITRIPSTAIVLNVDRMSAVKLEDTEELNKRYRFFEGTWIVTKVYNIIQPHAPRGKTYMQNIVMSKNFFQDDIPTNMKI